MHSHAERGNEEPRLTPAQSTETRKNPAQARKPPKTQKPDFAPYHMTRSTPVSTLAALALLAAMPVLPLFAPWQMYPVTSFHQEWLAMAAGLLAALCAWPLLRKVSVLAVPVIVWLPLVLAAVIVLQTLILPNVVDQHAGFAVAYLLWAALLMLLAGLLQQSLGLPRLAVWLAAGLLVAALWASGRELLARMLGEVGVWGGSGQPNHYANLLALGAASLLYLPTQIKPRRGLFIAAGLLVVLGLSLTPSRSVWLYWLALTLIAWRYQPDWLKPLGVGFVLYLLFQVVWTFDVFPAAQPTSAERLIQQASGASTRWHIWRVAWNLFLQQPLSGHGFGQFDWAYFQAGDYLPELSTRIEHAHNIVMHLLVELGVLPTLLFLVALAVWLKPLLSRSDEARADGGVKAWLLMLVAVLALHSLLEYPLWYAHFLGIAALLLALGEQRRWHLPMTRWGAALAGGFVSIGLVIATLHEWQYARMELALIATMTQPTLQREQRMIEICQRLPVTAPLLTPYIPVVFVLTGHPENPQMREQMLILADSAVRFTPTGGLVYRLALLQALADDTASARATLDKAMAAFPAGTIAFAEELLRIQAYAGPRIDVLMAPLVPVVNAKLQADLPAGVRAKTKQPASP